MTSYGIRPKIPNLAKCSKGFDLHTFRDYFSDVQVRIHSVLCFILSPIFFHSTSHQTSLTDQKSDPRQTEETST